MNFRSGIIAIVGKPNAGKSTLLNGLVGLKIAAVTAKPQTTRHNIRGILQTDHYQMVLVDTPGFHQSRKHINRFMIAEVKSALQNADVCLMLVDGGVGWKDYEETLLKIMIQNRKRYVIALTKVDICTKEALLPLMNTIHQKTGGAPIIPISALKSDGIDVLLREIEKELPVGMPLFPPDELTDQTMREIAAEMIREKLFDICREEIPYSLAVQIESYQEPKHAGDITRIGAVVIVERKSQKLIIIGKKGQILKQVGVLARQEIESMIGGKVFLSLFVKVAKDWTKDPIKRREFGYE